MARIFVVSEYVGANQNSTGYYWEKIIGKMQREFGGLTVIFPLTAGETPPVVSPSVEKNALSFRGAIRIGSFLEDWRRFFRRFCSQ